MFFSHGAQCVLWINIGQRTIANRPALISNTFHIDSWNLFLVCIISFVYGTQWNNACHVEATQVQVGVPWRYPLRLHIDATVRHVCVLGIRRPAPHSLQCFRAAAEMSRSSSCSFIRWVLNVMPYNAKGINENYRKGIHYQCIKLRVLKELDWMEVLHYIYYSEVDWIGLNMATSVYIYISI